MKRKKIMSAVMSLMLAASSVPFTSNAYFDEYVQGDVNLDGVVSIADLVMMQRYIFGTSERMTFAGDINDDYNVDIFDFCLLRRLICENCSEQPVTYTAVNIAENMTSNGAYTVDLDNEFALSQTEFALKLFKRSIDSEKNSLVSPYSVMQALAMTANGAGGETREEMEKALGGIPLDELNHYLYTQRINEPDGNDCSLSVANSIWSKDRYTVSPDFIKTDADYYGADFFKAPFDDSTLEDINSWVNNNTKGMIPEVLKKINSNAIMYLINAIAFEAKWSEPFYEANTKPESFTAFDGSVKEVDMMHSTETGYSYISDDNAQGFVKDYCGNYAFAALLPNEGVSLDEYISGLTSEGLNSTLKNRKYSMVKLSFPKFEYDYDKELSDTLIDMGMKTAFTQAADFMPMMPNADAYIGAVTHNTHIGVDEKGTKAAAATVVHMYENAIEMPEDKYTLEFNRPFLYCIYNTETNIPVFIGTLIDADGQ